MVRTHARFSAGSVALTIALALSVVASATNAALAPTLRIDPAAVAAGAKVDVVGRAFPAAVTGLAPTGPVQRGAGERGHDRRIRRQADSAHGNVDGAAR